MRELTTFEKAMQFAAIAHGKATRKMGGAPYVLHSMEAAVIASSMTEDQDVMAAAALHDVVEDTQFTEADIRERFGDRIADLVMSETEQKYPGRPSSETWDMRKEDSIRELAVSQDINVKILWLSDKLSNIRSFYRQYLMEGDALWQHYSQKNKKRQEWYYRAVKENTAELKDHAAYEEYSALIDKVFGKEV